MARQTNTSELLLDVLEAASLGPVTRSQVARQLRRAHPFARLDRRLDGALEVLRGEGLVEATEHQGAAALRTTQSGLEALEANGRYSDVATVMFTDIVGSTELIDSVGETAAHEIRQRHFSLLRSIVARHRGREVKNLGDGLMIIFADAEQAADCAGEMQRDVAADPDRIGLRVGINSGELLRDGNDFFGSAVIIARRLCDAAGSGQTLASERTCELLEDDAADCAKPVGRLALKGIAEPVAAAALAWQPAAESVG